MNYKPRIFMKKLERMDGKLFESLKVNEMTNLGAFFGGWHCQTTDSSGCEDTYKQDTDPRPPSSDQITTKIEDTINSTVVDDAFNNDGSIDVDIFLESEVNWD